MNKRLELINAVLTRYYYYWALAVFLLVGFIFWQWVLVKQYDSLQNSGVLRHEQLLTSIAEREQYLIDLQIMEDNYLALDHRLLRDLPVVLPSDYAATDVFTEIDKVFIGTSLTVQSVNVSTLGQAETAAGSTVDGDGDMIGMETDSTDLNQVYEIVLITVNAAVEPSPGAENSESAVLAYADFKQVLRRIEQQRHLLNLEQIVYDPTASNYTLILKTYQITNTIQ